MRLVSPATYLSVANFIASQPDYDLDGGYTNDALTRILVRASAKADAFMRKSYLPTKVTKTFEGDGTNELQLGDYPIIYLESLELVMPGFAPYQLPIGDIMVDYELGIIHSWSPMIWRSLGVSSAFPRNGLPIVATYAYGYGYPIPPPAFTLAPTNGILAQVATNFAVTTCTQPGESLPSAPQTVIPNAQGGVLVSIATQPGAYVYRIYASIGANTTVAANVAAGAAAFSVASGTSIGPGSRLTIGFGLPTCETIVVGEIAGGAITLPVGSTLANAHNAGEAVVAEMSLIAESPATNYGAPTMNVAIVSMLGMLVGGSIPVAPLVDSSAWPMPNEFSDAISDIAMSIIFEANNLANRGVNQIGEGAERTTFRSTEGNSGRGVPLLALQAQDALAPYVFSCIR